MIQRNVHHSNSIYPERASRTCLAAPEFSKHANKWSAAFETWHRLAQEVSR